MLYAVIDVTAKNISDKLVGYHEKRKVVLCYYFSLKKLMNTEKYKIVRCKKKTIKKIPNYYDYYLIRFGTNYIPSAYYEYYKESSETVLFEYKYVIEILSRVFEFEKLNSQERIAIEKSLMIVQNLLDDELDCVIHPDELKELDDMHERYKSQIFWNDKFDDDDLIPFSDLK